MPTRKRPETFPLALQSALRQRGSDFEIVVSNNGSDDLPQRTVEAADDSRIRYFRTPRVLNMVDSWNFALSQACGIWVTVLSDDDAIAPSLLRRVDDVIGRYAPDAITWSTWNYYPSFEPPLARGNSVTVRGFSGQITKHSSRQLLDELYGFRERPYFPVIQNCFCRRADLERVADRLGATFIPPAPDYTAGSALLGFITGTAHIDLPLRLAGTSRNATHYSPESFAEFVGALEDQATGRYAPIPSLSTVNIVAESICKVRDLMADKLGEVPIDLLGYIRYYFARLLYFEDRGFQLSDERQLLSEFLARQPSAFRRRAHLQMSILRLDALARRLSRKIMLAYPPLQELGAERFGRVVSGTEADFRDILGAVSYVDRLVTARGGAA